MEKVSISVIIPIRNPGRDFRFALQRICEQQIEWPFEILLIDSGSINKTLQICASFPVRVLPLTPRRFHHSATRNWAIQQASGDYIVLTVQDAIPVRDDWIRRLVTPLMLDSSVAGVYGRQLPRPDHGRLVHALHRAWFGDVIPLVQQTPECGFDELPLSERQHLSRFDNVTSCIRRAVWEQIPLPPVRFGEDFAWAAQVLRHGYRVVYEPEALVWHSHNRGLWHEFKRAYLMGDALCRVFGAAWFDRGPVTGWSRWAKWFIESWIYVWRRIAGLSGSEINRTQVGAILESWIKRCERRVINQAEFNDLFLESTASDACIERWLEFLWRRVSCFSYESRFTALAFCHAGQRLLESIEKSLVQRGKNITVRAGITGHFCSYPVIDWLRLIAGYLGLGAISAWKRRDVIALWLLGELVEADPSNVWSALFEMMGKAESELRLTETIVYDTVYKLLIQDTADKWDKNYVLEVWTYALLRVFGIVLGEVYCKTANGGGFLRSGMLRLLDSLLSAGIS